MAVGAVVGEIFYRLVGNSVRELQNSESFVPTRNFKIVVLLAVR